MIYTILICGSRTWVDESMIEAVLDHETAIQGHVSARIISGAAPGADEIAARCGRRCGYAVDEFPADWDKHGKAAGPIRNRTMLDQEPDLVVAFWDGESKGTLDTIREATKRGIPVHIYGKERPDA